MPNESHKFEYLRDFDISGSTDELLESVSTNSFEADFFSKPERACKSKQKCSSVDSEFIPRKTRSQSSKKTQPNDSVRPRNTKSTSSKRKTSDEKSCHFNKKAR